MPIQDKLADAMVGIRTYFQRHPPGPKSKLAWAKPPGPGFGRGVSLPLLSFESLAMEAIVVDTN